MNKFNIYILISAIMIVPLIAVILNVIIYAMRKWKLSAELRNSIFRIENRNTLIRKETRYVHNIMIKSSRGMSRTMFSKRAYGKREQEFFDYRDNPLVQ